MTPANLFIPKPNQTVPVSVTTSAASTSFNGGFETIRIVNAGTAIAFIELAGGTATTTNSMPLLPGTVESFSMQAMNGVFTVSLIGAAATTVYLTPGMGM